MRKHAHEIMGIPPQYQEGGTPEYPPLPDEFNRNAPVVIATEDRKKRLRRVMLLLAAVGLTVLGILFPRSVKSDAVEEPHATVSPVPTETATPAPAVALTAAPTETPSPESTSKPTAVPIPGVKITFYRRSEVYEAFVQWNVPEQLESIALRIYDVYLGTIWEYEPDAEERLFGYYWLHDFDLYDYLYSHEFDFDNVPPDYNLEPQMEVTYAYSGEDGPSDVETVEAAHEMWVSVHYDLPNPEEDPYAYMFGETTYPDCFVARIEEWMTYDGLRFFYGEREDLAPGDVYVTVTVDGQDIPAETCRLELEPHEYGDAVYYSYAFVMPRPESFPEHGTAHVSFTQKLVHYDTTYTRIREIEY